MGTKSDSAISRVNLRGAQLLFSAAASLAPSNLLSSESSAATLPRAAATECAKDFT